MLPVRRCRRRSAGLACNTLYHFRVVASNSAGVTNGGDTTFTTAACTPTVTTNAATAIAATGATQNGTVNSNGASTTVTFQYGLTTTYGSSVAAAQKPAFGQRVRCAGVGGDHRARLQHALPLPRDRGEQRRHCHRRGHDLHHRRLRADGRHCGGERDCRRRCSAQRRRQQQRRKHHGQLPVRVDDRLRQQRRRSTEPARGGCFGGGSVGGDHGARLQYRVPLPCGRHERRRYHQWGRHDVHVGGMRAPRRRALRQRPRQRLQRPASASAAVPSAAQASPLART